MYMGSRCYHAPELVFKIDGVEYYAADAMGIREFEGNAVLNLSNEPKTLSLEKIPDGLIEHMIIPYKEIMIPWQDGGIPYVRSSFWTVIHKFMVENCYKTVGIHCSAGHGRTGTALASIAIANLGWAVDEAVKYVRERICRHMVETSDQCNYLMALDYELNGREPKEESLPYPSMVSMFEEYYTNKNQEDESDTVEQNDFVNIDIEKSKEELEEEDEEYRKRKEE